MKVVELRIQSSREDVPERAAVSIESRRNDVWTRDSSYDVMTGTPEAERRVMLDDNQRLVVEAASATRLVMDREQNVATPEPIDDKAKEVKQKFDEDQSKLHEKNVEEDKKRLGHDPSNTPIRGAPTKPSEDPNYNPSSDMPPGKAEHPKAQPKHR